VEASSLLPSYVAFTGCWKAKPNGERFIARMLLYCPVTRRILVLHWWRPWPAVTGTHFQQSKYLAGNHQRAWRLAADDTAEGILLLLTRWITLHPEQQKLMAVRARQCYEKQFSVEMAARQMLQALGIDHKPASVKKYVAS